MAGDGDPAFYQFEGPLVRLIGDEKYQVYVHGSQEQLLDDPAPQTALGQASLWIYRFYDQAATTFQAPPHQNLVERLITRGRQMVTADGFNIEKAAVELYDFIMKIRTRTGAPKVFLVAHSMGGLIARCMIQKKCQQDGRLAARDIVAKLFTYGTPHGGIRSAGGVAPMDRGHIQPGWLEHFRPREDAGISRPGQEFRR